MLLLAKLFNNSLNLKNLYLILMFITISLLIVSTKSFYFPLQPITIHPQQDINKIVVSPMQRKCFLKNVFKEEKLLIQLETGILGEDVEAIVQVFRKIVSGQQIDSPHQRQRQMVLNETLRYNKFQHTVEKSSHRVEELNEHDSFEYETCVHLKKRKQIIPTNRALFPVIQPEPTRLSNSVQSYLIKLNLLTNFKHILQEKQSIATKTSNKQKIVSYSKQNLKQLKQMSQKLTNISQEQLQIHLKNQQLQKQTYNNIEAIQEGIFSLSILQSVLLVCGSLIHINLMRSYLKSAGIIE